MPAHNALKLILVGLILLGAISDIAIFFRSLLYNKEGEEIHGIKTLWGLFIVGTLVAIIWSLIIKANSILLPLGYYLSIVGTTSGLTLFIRAITGNKKIATGDAVVNLWKLFIVNTLIGVIILVILSH